MTMDRLTFAALGCAAVAAIAGCQRSEPLTAEAARARGDAMLRQMSSTLAATQVFSFTADESRERVRSNGEKATERFSRRIIVRRPNALTYTDTGGRSGGAWYDGKHLVTVSDHDRIWAKGPMPASLDEAMDFVSAEYGIQLPIADLLYSSPYDALITADTTGGWVDTVQIGGRACEHLAYHHPVVDWEIWLTQDERYLPCQLQITYKTEPGKPVTKVVFEDWNPSAQVSDATFVPRVPEGYQRLKIMRHATVVDETVGQETATPAAADAPAKPGPR
jgi:hypothetical protein